MSELKACCISGHLHSGKPVGHEETLNHLPTYVSAPEGGSREKSIIILTDIFGYKLPNVRLLADEYAKAGFFVYVPDLHESDSLPEDFLQDVEPPLKVREQLSLVDKGVKTAKVGATLPPWLMAHRESVFKPLVDGVINVVKTTPGTNKVGVVGFCHGGRYAILAAHDLVDAAFSCHPALLSIPADVEPVTKPTAVAIGDKDSLLSVDDVDKIRSVWADKSVPTQIEVYKDQVHGFALRGDYSDEADKKAQDAALQQGVAWFNKYLS